MKYRHSHLMFVGVALLSGILVSGCHRESKKKAQKAVQAATNVVKEVDIMRAWESECKGSSILGFTSAIFITNVGAC